METLSISQIQVLKETSPAHLLSLTYQKNETNEILQRKKPRNSSSTNMVACMRKFTLYILNYFNFLERFRILQTIIGN